MNRNLHEGTHHLSRPRHLREGCHPAATVTSCSTHELSRERHKPVTHFSFWDVFTLRPCHCSFTAEVRWMAYGALGLGCLAEVLAYV